MKFITIILIIISSVFLQATEKDLFNNTSNILSSSVENSFSESLNQEEAPSSEEAFIVDIQKEKNESTIFFKVLKGNYLYEKSLEIYIDGEIFSNYKIKTEEKDDPFFGIVNVMTSDFYITLNKKDFSKIKINMQGCSEKFHICYQKETREFEFAVKKTEAETETETETETNFINKLNFESLTESLENGSLIFNIFIFFIAGLVLSFTPCVLPMIPIISSIITSIKDLTPKKALFLSTFYVLGSSSAYSLIGYLSATTTTNIQGLLQKPIFIILSSVILFILALSMAGLFNFKTPSIIDNKIDKIISKIKISHYSVFIIGFLSTLIVSPCVAAPLAAAVIYISSTGNQILGAASLFSFGLGLGLILIVISTSLNKVKIKSGSYMMEVKNIISLAIVLTSIYMLERIVDERVSLSLYFIAITFYTLRFIDLYFKKYKNIIRLLLITFISYLLILSPNLKNNEYVTSTKNSISSISEYENIINSNKNVLVKVTADWCVYCKKMEKETFSTQKFKDSSEDISIFYIDLTDDDVNKNELISKLKIVGPPALLFIKNQNIIQKDIGFKDSEYIINSTKNLFDNI